MSGLWKKTKYANLRIYSPTGTYYVHAHVNGKLVRESLRTTSATIAQAARDELLKSKRGKPQIEKKPQTFGAAAQSWLLAIDKDKNLKPGTRVFKHNIVGLIKRTWPELFDTVLWRIKSEDCDAWGDRLSARVGATRYNGAVLAFRNVLKFGGVKGDFCKLKRQKVVSRKPTLPDTVAFQKMLEFLNEHPQRREAYDLVRLLAYSGMRISEARNALVEHVDLVKNKLTVFGDLEKDKVSGNVIGTKTAPFRVVPINAPLRVVLEDMIAGRTCGKLTPLTACTSALDGACRHVETERLTHHDLRDMFATRCIESGVDIPTVAKWLGHKDGGALLMKTYAHLRDEHSAEMAKKVMF